jgi:hypothetical protein
VTLALRALLALRGRKETQETLGRKVHRDRQVPLVQLGRKGRKAFKALPVRLEPRAIQETLVQQALPVPQAHKARQEVPEPLVPLERKATRATPGQLGRQARKVLRERRGQPGRRGQQVRPAQLVRKAQLLH